MNNYDELMLIRKMNSLLIKEWEAVNNRDVFIAHDDEYNFWLLRQQIYIRLSNSVEFTNIYYYSILAFFIDRFLNAKDRITKRR